MGKLAAAFPGQGVQFPGMAGRFVTGPGRALFDTASETLGFDLFEVMDEGSEADLSDTRIAQPALLTTCLAIWQAWESDRPPDFLMGHSLGQVVAATAADAMTFADAVRTAERRGAIMADRSADGSMMALIGLDEEAAASVCDRASNVGYVVPANFNAPGQIVISGERDAVERAGELAAEAGARRVVKLAVSGPFHSVLMERAAQEFGEFLESVTILEPSIPLIGNVDNTILTTAADVRRELTAQLTSPVRWVENVELAFGLGVDEFVEMSPKAVLGPMVKRICKDIRLTLA